MEYNGKKSGYYYEGKFAWFIGQYLGITERIYLIIISYPPKLRSSKLKVLDSNNDLENTLKSFSNQRIKIITAFASGTE